MITKSLHKKLKEEMILLLIIPNKKYPQTLLNLTRELEKESKRLCYVSLNKLTEPLINTLKHHHIPTSNITFIDGISKTALPKLPRIPNVQYIPAPNALLDLNLAIAEVSVHKHVDTVLFDSPSTMLVYEKSAKVKKFIHFQTIKLRSLGIKTVFTCLKGDTNTDLINSISMLVDEVVTLR